MELSSGDFAIAAADDEVETRGGDEEMTEAGLTLVETRAGRTHRINCVR